MNRLWIYFVYTEVLERKTMGAQTSNLKSKQVYLHFIIKITAWRHLLGLLEKYAVGPLEINRSDQHLRWKNGLTYLSDFGEINVKRSKYNIVWKSDFLKFKVNFYLLMDFTFAGIHIADETLESAQSITSLQPTN